MVSKVQRPNSMVGRLRRSGAVLVTGALVALGAATAPDLAAEQTPAKPQVTFKTGVDLVMVDVVVRDKSGAIVRGPRSSTKAR